MYIHCMPMEFEQICEEIEEGSMVQIFCLKNRISNDYYDLCICV